MTVDLGTTRLDLGTGGDPADVLLKPGGAPCPASVLLLSELAEPGFARRSLTAGTRVILEGGGSRGNHGFPRVYT